MRLPSSIRFALAALAAATTLTVGAVAPERADAARILSSTFLCQVNLGLLGINAPELSDQQQQWVWWYPMVYRQLGSGWQLAATPGFYYRQASDPGGLWTRYADGGRDYGAILRPGPGNYAVVNWVYDGGWGYSIAENALVRGNAICPLG